VFLDTHALLWWFTDDDRLSETAREIIANRRERDLRQRSQRLGDCYL